MDIVTKLQELGYTDTEDISCIVDYLTDVYTPEQVEAILEHFPACGEFTSFNGQNCDDARYNDDDPECGGWDGLSSRCECGNRRVAWTFDGNWAYGDAH